MHVAAQPIELGHDDRCAPVVVILDFAGGLQCLCQFGPVGERIALGGLDLRESLDEMEGFRLGEPVESSLLRFKAKARFALRFGADPDVCDCRLWLPGHHSALSKRTTGCTPTSPQRTLTRFTTKM